MPTIPLRNRAALTCLLLNLLAGTAHAASIEAVMQNTPPTPNNNSTVEFPLVQASDGRLYGATGNNTITTPAALIFFRLDADGRNPQELRAGLDCMRGRLIAGRSDGYLYSTYNGIQRYNIVTDTCETLISTADLTTALGTTGTTPPSMLLESADGERLYGIHPLSTQQSVFSIRKDGSDVRLLKIFSTGTTDLDAGRTPRNLILAENGGLLGITNSGGGVTSADPDPANPTQTARGVVFHLGDDGSYTKLHVFNREDGDLGFNTTHGSLVQVPGGDIFGTAYAGGPNCSTSNNNCGVVFRMKADGSDFTILHAFNSDNIGPDGRQGVSATYIAQDPVNPEGVVLVTTQQGGANGAGTVLAVHPVKGMVIPIYSGSSMSSATTVGRIFGFMQAADGSIYGNGNYGGTAGRGMFFRFDPGVLAFAPYVQMSATTSYTGNTLLRPEVPVVQNKPLVVSWVVGLVQDCTATSNDPGSEWHGPQASSGSNKLTVIPRSTGVVTYTLTCLSAEDGTTPVSFELTATVLPEFPDDLHVGGGGSMNPAWLWLLAAAALLRRRRT